MRVLMTAPGAEDRVHNLVPLGWALRAAGHFALLAAPPALLATVTGTGLVAVEAGREDGDDVIAFAEQWRPDCVVWDRNAPVGAAVAGRLGVPSLRMLDVLDDPASSDGAACDVTFDPTPPSLRPAPTAGTVAVRHVPYDGARILPSWLARPVRRPRVLIDASDVGGLLPALLDALAGLNAEVEALCLAPGAAAAAVTQIPDSVRLLESAPLTALIPTCAVVATDRPRPAAAAIAHGVARLPLGPVDDLAERIRRAVADPAVLAEAARLRIENEAVPGPADLVAWCERWPEDGFEAGEAGWPTTTSC